MFCQQIAHLSRHLDDVMTSLRYRLSSDVLADIGLIGQTRAGTVRTGLCPIILPTLPASLHPSTEH